jgi:micrococcal nuclease
MRTFLVCLLLLGISAGVKLADRGGFFGHSPLSDAQTYDGKTFRVTHVVDGDTLDVDAPDGPNAHTRVRLWGVDTPETVKPDTPVQHFGPEASAFTRRCAMEKGVRLELEPSQTRDKYGRLLAYVYLPDGRMLNREIVQEGFGFADPRYDHPYKVEFIRLQDQARRRRLGLWKDVKSPDLPYYMQSSPSTP